jgi:SAM-dependent methyltransferase
MTSGNRWDFAYRTNDTHGADFLAKVWSLADCMICDRPAQVLEVGCGDGGKLLRLAERWPRAQLTGIDLSEMNIRLAEEARQASPARDRLRFLSGDYLQLPLGRFDLILADNVLHLIPGPTDRLFAKLTGELTSGGLLLFSIPYSCLYNALLTALRRVLRLFRTPLLDRMLLTLARALHGRQHSSEFLRERLEYAYILPERMGSPALERDLAQHHLVLEARLPYLHASPAQFKHYLWCFRCQPQTPSVPHLLRSA